MARFYWLYLRRWWLVEQRCVCVPWRWCRSGRVVPNIPERNNVGYWYLGHRIDVLIVSRIQTSIKLQQESFKFKSINFFLQNYVNVSNDYTVLSKQLNVKNLNSCERLKYWPIFQCLEKNENFRQLQFLFFSLLLCDISGSLLVFSHMIKLIYLYKFYRQHFFYWQTFSLQ